jgi:mannose-6-phosphate isomerase-like protein (cupin superfamily)
MTEPALTDSASGASARHAGDRGGSARGSGLPGGVAVSRLRVYDWPASDGLRGGSPHLHTASTEAYVVLAGRGRVETLSSRGIEVTDLAPGTVAWFTPGTVHRLINDDGELDILTIMSNAGLPEAGDAVLTFPMTVLADASAYARHAVLPIGRAEADVAAAARARRDLALEGFASLRERAASDLDGALDELYSASAKLVAHRAGDWKQLVASGPSAQVHGTERQLEALADGLPGILARSGITAIVQQPEPRYGMCGMLTVWDAAR